MQNHDYKAGEIVILTAGEYSDYRHECVCRVLKDFNLLVVEHEFFKENPPCLTDEWQFYQDRMKFKPWLISQSGYLEEIAHREMWFEHDETMEYMNYSMWREREIESQDPEYGEIVARYRREQ